MGDETMRCPTCGAVQVWSDACRRCKCDLRLLREAAEDYARRRSRCLAELNRNHFRAALAEARHCIALRDDAEGRKLLAVCAVLNGNWAEALLLAPDFGTAEMPIAST